MLKSITRRLSIVGLSLVLTSGLLVGCGTGNTDSTSTQTSDQQVAKQSEMDHESNEGDHEDEAHEDEHEHEHDHERADHFEGKEAETYDEAVSNMKTANNRLEELLAQDELAGSDFLKIHRMSYTMENALAVIREESDGDYEDVAESLEAVHLASEKRDAKTVRQEGQKYLDGANAMLEME
jgi:hypothetical protein